MGQRALSCFARRVSQRVGQRVMSPILNTPAPLACPEEPPSCNNFCDYRYGNSMIRFFIFLKMTGFLFLPYSGIRPFWGIPWLLCLDDRFLGYFAWIILDSDHEIRQIFMIRRTHKKKFSRSALGGIHFFALGGDIVFIS